MTGRDHAARAPCCRSAASRRSSSPRTARASARCSCRARNERDLDDVPKDIRDELKVHLIKRVDEVLPLVLEPPLSPPPQPQADDGREQLSEQHSPTERRKYPRLGDPVAAWRSLPLPRRVAAIVVVSWCSGPPGSCRSSAAPATRVAWPAASSLPSATAIAAALELSARDDIAPLTAVARGGGARSDPGGLAYRDGAPARPARRHVRSARAAPCSSSSLRASARCSVALWGAVVAETCRRRTWRRLTCVLLAIAGPLGGIAVSVARFYGSPMVLRVRSLLRLLQRDALRHRRRRAPGALDVPRRDAGDAAGGALLASALLRTGAGKLAFRPLRGNAPAIVRLALGVAALAISVAVTVEGPSARPLADRGHHRGALGGRAERRALRRGLPGLRCWRSRRRCSLRDCEDELAADEKRLGAHLDGRLTAFVFRDSDEKRRLMGAAETSIAKPWRREVYVQLSGLPAPILGHEIAHVVAGTFGRGPFRIAGGLGGLWPNPGLIEGIAVATSPDDDELTDAQWARAMLDLGILPSVHDLFSLGFLGENASKSYTVAGAFVSWVLDSWGNAALRAWYGGASWRPSPASPGRPRRRASATALRALPMPAETRPRMPAPSSSDPACGLARARTRSTPSTAAPTAAGTSTASLRAVSLYDEALARDPHDWHARFDRARVDARPTLDEAQGRDALFALAGDDLAPRTWRDRAQEALADDDLTHGRDARGAEATYRSLASRTLDEDVARTLEVKAVRLGNPPARRADRRFLLVGEPGRPVDSWLGALSLGQLGRGRPHEPLAGYLAGKNLALHGEYDLAAGWLDRALDAGVSSPRIGRELLRQRAICACALGDRDGLARVKNLVEEPGSPFEGSSGGRRDWVLRLVARCGPAEERKTPRAPGTPGAP